MSIAIHKMPTQSKALMALLICQLFAGTSFQPQSLGQNCENVTTVNIQPCKLKAKSLNLTVGSELAG